MFFVSIARRDEQLLVCVGTTVAGRYRWRVGVSCLVEQLVYPSAGFLVHLGGAHTHSRTFVPVGVLGRNHAHY